MPSLRDKTPSRAWTMRLARSTAVGLVLGSGLGVLQLHADAQSLPDFFPAHLKDDYMELISADLLAEDTCAKRLAIYKELAQVGIRAFQIHRCEHGFIFLFLLIL